VADEQHGFEQRGEVRKREVLGELNWLSLPRVSQFLRSFSVCFAGDNYEPAALLQKKVAELDPVFDRPVLRLTAAAGVERDRFLSVGIQEMRNGPAIFVIGEETRRRIAKRKTDRLKGPRQLAGRMFAVVEPGRSGEKSRGCALPHIRFENLIEIKEVTQDQIETRQVIGQLTGELGVSREESSERWRIYGPNGVSVEPFLRKRRDVFGAENFQMRPGETIAQQFYRGQRQDKIADGAAANEQDAVQVSNA
jgi:hypothetical protein